MTDQSPVTSNIFFWIVLLERLSMFSLPMLPFLYKKELPFLNFQMCLFCFLVLIICYVMYKR